MTDYSQGLIYIVKCSEDKRVYYGSTVRSLENRISVHKCYSKTLDTKFYRAIKEYGWDKFSFEIVERFNCNSKKELVRREFDWIEKCSPADLFNTEIKFGELSEETKRLLSESNKEAWTEERKREQSEAMSESLKGNKNSFKGGCVSENKTNKCWGVIWYINNKRHSKYFSYGIRSSLTSENAKKTAEEFKSKLVF